MVTQQAMQCGIYIYIYILNSLCMNSNLEQLMYEVIRRDFVFEYYYKSKFNNSYE